MIMCFLQLCYYRIPLITKNVNHASLLSWHLFYFILTFYFILFLFAPEDISGLRSNNVLEERDPEYDAMLNKMLGRITTKPGGKLEMGEVRTFKQTKKKRNGRGDVIKGCWYLFSSMLYAQTSVVDLWYQYHEWVISQFRYFQLWFLYVAFKIDGSFTFQYIKENLVYL